MEDGHPAAQHSPVLDHHPPHEPTTVVGEEEHHHEKKSIMTRIQNKVNKMKHNYKNRHAHDQVSEVPVEEESEEFDSSHEDMDVDSEGGSNLSAYESTSREFDGERGTPVTLETDKPHVLGGRDEPPVTLETEKPQDFGGRAETEKPQVFGGRDTLETDKPYILGDRDESPVTLDTEKPQNFGDQDTLESNKQYSLGGGGESPVTLKPHVLGGGDTLETDKPFFFGGRDEPPVTLETDKSFALGGRDTLETDKSYVHGGRDELPATLETERDELPVTLETETDRSYVLGRDEPPVSLEMDKSHVLGGRDEPMKATTVEEDPVAPLPYGSLPRTIDADADADINLPISVGPTPGNESSVPPEVLSSLRAMSISEQRRDQPPYETQPCPEDETPVNQMSPDMEKKPSYTEKLGTTAAADEAAVSAAPTEYSAGTVSGPTGTPPPSYSEIFSSPAFAAKDATVSAESTEYSTGTVPGPTSTPPPSYSEKFSSAAFTAKDAAVSAASMVYGKVAGKEGTHSSETGGEVVTPVSNVAGTEEGAGEKKDSYTDRAYAAKDAASSMVSSMYGMMMGAGAAMMGNAVETEKLQPGEEDKALSEVIPESVQKGGEEDEAVVKGRIELPEVTSREVVSDAPAEVLTDAPLAVDAKSGGYTGQGMMEKITGAVTSFVGGGGGVADAPAASGGAADTPVVVVEGHSGGAGKETGSDVLGE